MTDRADIQSFDFRTLLIVQQKFPKSVRCISSAIFRFLPIRISRAPTTVPICRMKMVEYALARRDVLALSFHGATQLLPRRRAAAASKAWH